MKDAAHYWSMSDTQPTATDSRTFLLSPAEFEATQRKFEKVAARAVKRGFSGTLELTGERALFTEQGPSGLELTRYMYRCSITGAAPCYDSWEFLARLEALPAVDGELLWLVNTAPGITDEQVDRGALEFGRCEHCGTVRSNRKKTFLVRHTVTGETKQVGSSCMKDFLGWNTNPVWIDPDSILTEADRAGGGLAVEQAWLPLTVFVAAAASVSAYGWAPATSEGVSTKRRVEALLCGRSARDHELTEGVAERIQEVQGTAEDDFAEAVRRSDSEQHGYVANLHAALSAEEVTPRTFGLICSAVSFLYRERERAAEKLAKVEDTSSEWVGELNEQIEFTGTVIVCRHVEGFTYGSTQVFLILKDADGNVAKVSTSAQWAYDVEHGDQLTVSAKVKKHDVFGGVKQTVLLRPKLVARTPSAPEAEG